MHSINTVLSIDSNAVMSTKFSTFISIAYPRRIVLSPSKVLELQKYLLTTCTPRITFATLSQPHSITISKRMSWSIKSSVDINSGSNLPGNSENRNSRDRLVRVIKGLQVKAIARIKGIQKGFPVKLMLFLVGFYSATAFSTVIGQTGDWDILSAGLAVIVVEGIGALMYKDSFPLISKIKGLVTVFNYWKAGLSLGLFLDAFKYDIDYNIFSSFEFDLFSVFL